MNITIAIADDHRLFLRSLATLINSIPGFEVVLEAVHGRELLGALENSGLFPDILLLDVNMPVLDGQKTALEISGKYPAMRMVALSMKDDDETVIAMLKAGCCAYLTKDIPPDELEKALIEVYRNGYYNGDLFNVNYRRLLTRAVREEEAVLNEREQEFLRLSCSDLTYKEIAAKMHLSERTIDGYREALFEKLRVKSRVGMALEAIRKHYVTL